MDMGVLWWWGVGADGILWVSMGADVFLWVDEVLFSIWEGEEFQNLITLLKNAVCRSKARIVVYMGGFTHRGRAETPMERGKDAPDTGDAIVDLYGARNGACANPFGSVRVRLRPAQ
jgi:hypothetical protein